MKRSKRYTDAADKFDSSNTYTLDEAITMVKQSPVKFDAGVEIHLHLGIDIEKSDQIVRGTVILPHGSGKTKTVAAFVPPEKEAEAKEAGADIIGNQEYIDQIKSTKKCAFDVAVATPNMMKQLGPIAKILGQQGLMPSPKTDTVGEDVKTMVSELKTGKTAYRSDDSGNVHILVGRVSFEPEQLKENITTCLDSVKKAKPAESKGVFLQTVTICSSMGPGIQVQIDA